MTREIKFRAWSPLMISMSPAASLQEWCYIGYDPKLRALDYPKAILMQFTGLKDKNGKEIYEGDIVKSDQWEPPVYQVCWDRGAFYLADENRKEIADIKYVETFEVIGNIYENKELIK